MDICLSLFSKGSPSDGIPSGCPGAGHILNIYPYTWYDTCKTICLKLGFKYHIGGSEE